MSVINNALSFIVAIAILVAVHEFGHYWVARKLGVKVLRFSIGFGSSLYTRVAGKDQTEYTIGMIPLGGYVKMLDEREGDVSESEVHRAFNRQSVWTRIAIVAAGPMFNFLLAIVLYAMMYMVGVNGVKPQIGEVEPKSLAAQAGLKDGDLVLSVNGIDVASWSSTSMAFVDQALDTGQVAVKVETAQGDPVSRVLDLSNTRDLLNEGDLLLRIGIHPWRPRAEARFGQLIKDGPAARAGIEDGDRIVSIDGVPMESWEDVVKYVQAHPHTALSLVLQREGARLDIRVTTDEMERDGKVVGRIGAMPYFDRAEIEKMRVTESYGPLEAFSKGIEKTWDMTALTVRMMGKLVTGAVSPSNISGPLSIAEYAGVTAGIGISAFLGFLALLSVSLGVLNLLPVPVLDGGHLLFYAIELVKGSPLSEAAQELGQRVGLALLGTLMFFAFYNDISRLLG